MKMKQSKNLLNHEPILNMDDVLMPLNDCEDGFDWGTEIGFKKSPFNLSPAEKKRHGSAKSFESCSFTTRNGEELPKFHVPLRDDSRTDLPPNTPLPTFSIINFKTIPIYFCQSLMLKNHAASMLGCENTRSREELVDLTEDQVR